MLVGTLSWALPNFRRISPTISSVYDSTFVVHFTLHCALISGIARNEFLVAVQQVFQLIQIMFVGGGGHQCMSQANLGIHTYMGFHTEVPFIALLGLMHLRVTFILFVFSGAGRFFNRGINQCSLRHHHTAVCQSLVNRFE